MINAADGYHEDCIDINIVSVMWFNFRSTVLFQARNVHEENERGGLLPRIGHPQPDIPKCIITA